MGNRNSVRELLDERNPQYGEAWLLTGLVISNMTRGDPEIFHTLHVSPFSYSWTMIQNKLHRLLADPFHYDSWRDIAGYAQLVCDYLDANRVRTLKANVIHQGVERELEE